MGRYVRNGVGIVGSALEGGMSSGSCRRGCPPWQSVGLAVLHRVVGPGFGKAELSAGGRKQISTSDERS